MVYRLFSRGLGLLIKVSPVSTFTVIARVKKKKNETKHILGPKSSVVKYLPSKCQIQDQIKTVDLIHSIYSVHVYIYVYSICTYIYIINKK